MALEDFEPEIWRQVQIAPSESLAQLGYTLQVLFEMTASHLMVIQQEIANGEVARFDFTHTDFYDPIQLPNFVNLDIREHKISDVFDSIGDVAVMDYDFGDDWQIKITLEKILKVDDVNANLPRVIAGAGFGIVEDIGGVGGLSELAEEVDFFDIEHFDVEDLNFRIKHIPRIYRAAYEDYADPTQADIDLIDRAYMETPPNRLPVGEEMVDEMIGVFGFRLRESGLSEKVITRHCDNIETYFSYLAMAGEGYAPQDAEAIADFLGYWFPKKCMWASEDAVKKMAASLNKFFKFIFEIDGISAEEFADIKETIKSAKEEGFEMLDYYR